MPEIKIINNDSLIALKDYPGNYFDSVVADPPYGMGKEPNPNDVMRDWIEKGYHEIKNGKGFMNKKWDAFVPQPILWKEVFRVLKPGGHLLSFCGTRTYDWMVMSLRFAGFEIRDSIVYWHYGSGFPKSMDISKALDKKAGAERKVVGIRQHPTLKDKTKIDRQGISQFHANNSIKDEWPLTEPSTEQAKQWGGWGTALKPASEPICVARKPLSEKTIAENILKWGTGGINIDGCRIELNGDYKSKANGRPSLTGLDDNYNPSSANQSDTQGRFPANVIFDEESGRILDAQSGHLKSGNVSPDGFKGDYNAQVFGKYASALIKPETVYADEGGASRFFYCAKSSKSERNKGLEIREDSSISGNFHPTVKPLKLISYLVRMVTPPNGIVLDPFNGSGTGAIACKIEGFNYVGIEKEKEYCDISEARIKGWDAKGDEYQEQLTLF